MTTSKELINLSMNNNDYLKFFKLQYSYDKKPKNESKPTKEEIITRKKYFDIDLEGLRINMHSTDLSHSSSHITDPRSEIRGLFVIKDNIKYISTWDQKIGSIPSGYKFCFMQIFAGDVPNVMMRILNDGYQIGANISNKKITLKTTNKEDIGKFVNWKIEFLLANKGYIRIYKNNLSVGEIIGDLRGNANSYWKQGIYTQGHVKPKNMTLHIKNLKITQIY